MRTGELQIVDRQADLADNFAMHREPERIEIGLNATIVAMVDNNPAVLIIPGPGPQQADALPYGQFNPLKHRTMETALRDFVEAQTKLRPGYVEQLYTFGDRGRSKVAGDDSPHVVSVGYLALTKIGSEVHQAADPTKTGWQNWYQYLPWEDWRKGRPTQLDELIIPALLEWAAEPERRNHSVRGLDAHGRVRVAFGLEESDWDDELVLDRYELVYSAGLVKEAIADGRISRTRVNPPLGNYMIHDHRRILATAIARLRAKLKYRPVIFELMPESFTLTALQQTVESIFGRAVHKQNFRRQVEHAGLVEPTGASQHSTGGRPAALFKFREAVLQERPAPGLRVGRG